MPYIPEGDIVSQARFILEESSGGKKPGTDRYGHPFFPRQLLECIWLATDEIERLRERCEAYKGQVECGAMEIERLRAALATIADKTHPPQFDDVEPYDGLHTNSVRDFAIGTLKP